MSKRLELLQKHRKYVDWQMQLWIEYSHNLDEKISLYERKIKEQQK